jgi:hypothetical protein
MIHAKNRLNNVCTKTLLSNHAWKPRPKSDQSDPSYQSGRFTTVNPAFYGPSRPTFGNLR